MFFGGDGGGVWFFIAVWIFSFFPRADWKKSLVHFLLRWMEAEREWKASSCLRLCPKRQSKFSIFSCSWHFLIEIRFQHLSAPAILTRKENLKDKWKNSLREVNESTVVRRLQISFCIPPSIKLQPHIGEQNLSLWAEMQKCALISHKNLPLERILLGEQLMIHLALKWNGFWVKEATLNYRFEFSWRSNLPCMNKIFRDFGMHLENSGCLVHCLQGIKAI